jgi:hypothetical protein
MTSVPQGSAEKPPEGVHHIWPYTGQLKAVELKHLGAAGRQAGGQGEWAKKKGE